MSTYWKGHEPWERCGNCGTLRPTDALEQPFRGAASLTCKDKAWCVARCKALARAQTKNGAHKSVLDEK